jgi:hydrogenase/urease accessory protein HupE
MRQTRIRIFSLILAGVCGALGAADLRAHELGTIRTYADFHRDGRFSIEIFIDREHLPPGFAASAVLSRTPIRGLSASLERAPVGRILAEVANHSAVFFDGRPVPFELAWKNPDSAAAESILQLAGDVPGGARVFVWKNSLPLGTYLLTIRSEGEDTPARQWVEGGSGSVPFALNASVVPPTRGQIARQYLSLGYTHILPKGLDHILFVLGIFLLSTRLKPVLVQVTAFTVAHTITLALTMYGVVSLRSSIVEPLIAVSIVYVAVENVLRPQLSPWRVALVFAFGLLHGMGFAGVLSHLGLPRSEFATALLCFNAGVELGQLSVILLAFLLLGLPFRRESWYRRRVVVPASLAIAAVGLFWAIQRILPSLV